MPSKGRELVKLMALDEELKARECAQRQARRKAPAEYVCLSQWDKAAAG